MKMPQATHLLTLTLCMLGLVSIAPSCKSEIHSSLSAKREIRLQQSLLRESAGLLSQIWGTKVELDSEVARIADLPVDYSPGKGVSLEEALYDMLAYVAENHHVQLKWAMEGDRILITK